jgi:hypothetical protein
MEHTLRKKRVTICSIGVFMTASEANRQRVIALLLFEEEQMCAQFGAAVQEVTAVQRGKSPIFETRQPRISGPSI